MRDSKHPFRHRFVPELTVALILSGAVLLRAESSDVAPELCLAVQQHEMAPGEQIRVVALSPAAVLDWRLDGKGHLQENANNKSVLYTAPKIQGATDRLTVVTAAADEATKSSTLLIQVASNDCRGEEPGPRSPHRIDLDDVGVPGGWMGPDSGKSIELTGLKGDECGGSRCSRFTYKKGQGWAGIYWWPRKCDRGDSEKTRKLIEAGKCSLDLAKAGELKKIKAVTFHARGEIGDELLGFSVKNARGDEAQARITLQKKWKVYSLDLTKLDLTKASHLFAWTASDIDNPDGLIFYLKEVGFEGTRQ